MLQGSLRLWRSVHDESTQVCSIDWQPVSRAAITEVLAKSVVSGRQCKHVPTQVRNASGMLDSQAYTQSVQYECGLVPVLLHNIFGQS